jgi:putative ABC transport system permease protein
MLLRASIRHLWQQRGLAALALLAIGLAVALCVAVWQTNRSAVASFGTAAQRLQGDATHTIHAGPNGIAPAWYAEQRRQGILRLASPKMTARVMVTRIDADGHERRERATLLGIDPFAAGELVSDFGFDGIFAAADLNAALRGEMVVFGRAGRWSDPGPSEAAASQAAASQAAASQAAVSTTSDSQATLWYGNQQHHVRIVDADPRLVYLPDMLVADLATADVLLGANGQLTAIDVVLDSPQALAELSADLPAGAVIRPASAISDDLDALSAAFRLNLGALAALACLVAIYLVVSTINLWTVERQPWFAHLRAIGATPHQLVRIIFSEAFLMGFLGAGLGLLSGQAVALVTSALTTQTVQDFYANVPILAAQGDLSSLGLAVLLGPLLAVIAAVPAAVQCWRLSPRQQSLQRSQANPPRSAWLALGGLSVGSLVLGVVSITSSQALFLGWLGILFVIFGVTGLAPLLIWALLGILRPLISAQAPPSMVLGISWPLRSLLRLGPATAALTLALAASLGVAVMVQAFRGNVTDWLGRVLSADVYVSAEGSAVSDQAIPLPADLVERIRGMYPDAHMTTVADIEVVTQAPAKLAPAKPATAAAARDTVPWAITIIDSDHAIDFTTIGSHSSEEVWQALQAGAVLMSEPLAYERGLTVGDTVIFPTNYHEISDETQDQNPAAGETDDQAALQLSPKLSGHALPIHALVTDFTPDGGRVTLHRTTARKLGWDAPVSGISLRFPEQWTVTEKNDALANIQSAFVDQPFTVLNSAALRALSLELFDRTFTITAVLQVLTAVVAAAGMIVAGMAHQFERRREWAMLRSMGAEPQQVSRIVITGQVVLGIGAGVVAVPFGVLMAWLLAAVVNVRSFGWTLQLSVDPWLCVQTVVIAILTAGVAGWLPARWINKTPMTEAMRWE